MTLRHRAPACFAFAALACATAPAQQLIGYINTRDAEITGATDTFGGQSVLTGSASVTARDKSAGITLGRGGLALVCQGSALHVSESKSSDIAAPLLFSLDRGAIELQTNATLNDTIITPDLRFTIIHAGPLDLRLRIARNGDTCVENRGANAPTLDISDPFGESMYQVSAGQHVLFEHGSLHEVVDHETSACGCPAPTAPSIADALIASGPTSQLGAPRPAATQTIAAPTLAPIETAEQQAARAAVIAAEAHPFPEAISAGLAPPPEAPPVPANAPHVQITDTLVYNAQQPEMTAVAPPPTPPQTKKQAHTKAAAKSSTPSSSTTATPPPRDLVHLVGGFFRRLFRQ